MRKRNIFLIDTVLFLPRFTNLPKGLIFFFWQLSLHIKTNGSLSWATSFHCCRSKIGTLFLLSAYAKVECNKNGQKFSRNSIRIPYPHAQFHTIKNRHTLSMKLGLKYCFIWLMLHTQTDTDIVQRKYVATLYVASQVNKRCAHCLIQTRNCSIALFCVQYLCGAYAFLLIVTIHTFSFQCHKGSILYNGSNAMAAFSYTPFTFNSRAMPFCSC